MPEDQFPNALAVAKALGKLEADNESAKNQRVTLFNKIDAQSEKMQRLHDEQKETITAAIGSIRDIVKDSRRERVKAIAEVGDRVTTLENDKRSMKATAVGVGIGSAGGAAGLTAYWDKFISLFGSG